MVPSIYAIVPLRCMTLATSLDMNIDLNLVHCTLESALWQRLSGIKVELEFSCEASGILVDTNFMTLDS